MNKNIRRIILFILTLTVVIMLFFLIKEQIIEIIKLAKENKKDEIRIFIQERGLWGYISIIIIEAIQMVVVIIPAEFVQLSAGISYPFYIAILLCLLGVFLGSTIIYLLVNYLRFDKDLFSNSSRKINKINKQKKVNITTQLLMYLLFIMPIIPFGAICYFGSSSKLSYRRYILTCTTGVIPSILTSIIMGNAIVYLTSKGASIWLIILTIIGLASILFLTVMLVIRKYFFDEESKKGPNPLYYAFFYLIFKIYVESKLKVKVDNKAIEELNGPMIVLANHQSFFDFYHITKYLYPNKVTLVGNNYYFRFPFIRFIFKKIHVIPKTLFSPDIETVKKIIEAINNKQNVVVFPEGRLCADGENYPIIENMGNLIKKLNVPVVIVGINGAYSSKPKWGKKIRRGKVDVYTKQILLPKDLENLSNTKIDEIILNNLTNNEYQYILEHNYKYHSRNKANDISELLYICPHCHKLYTLHPKGNMISCNNCGFSTLILPNYQLKELSNYQTNIYTISSWNHLQKEIELQNINNNIYLEQAVTIKKISLIYPKLDKQGKGICLLTNETFSFNGDINDEHLSFSYPIEKLKALAYSGNEEFECYYNNELYYFYPNENKYQVVRWALLVDLLYKEKITKNEK